MTNNTLSLVRINATAVLEVVSSALPHNNYLAKFAINHDVFAFKYMSQSALDKKIFTPRFSIGSSFIRSKMRSLGSLRASHSCWELIAAGSVARIGKDRAYI